MELVNLADIQSFQESKVIKKVPIITNQLMTTIFFIDSNTDMPRHKHSGFDEIQYIVEGSGEITIDSESRSIDTGMLILVPQTKPHTFTTLKTRMTVLSIGLINGDKNK